MDAQLLEDDVVAAIGFQHAPQYQRGGDILRNNGGNADTRYAEIELDDQKQVETDIDDAGKEKEDQGPAGIAHAAQYRRTKVIQHTARHPQKVDAQIQNSQWENIVGGIHQPQDGGGTHHAHYHDKETADESHQHAGVGGLGDILVLGGAVVLGNDGAAADGDAHK